MQDINGSFTCRGSFVVLFPSYAHLKVAILTLGLFVSYDCTALNGVHNYESIT
jgi:hypothetical protein